MLLYCKKLSSENAITSTPMVEIHCASKVLRGGRGWAQRHTARVANR